IGTQWQNEDPAIKKKYGDIARWRMEEHRQMYPDYKYRPVKKTASSSAAAMKKDAAGVAAGQVTTPPKSSHKKAASKKPYDRATSFPKVKKHVAVVEDVSDADDLSCSLSLSPTTRKSRVSVAYGSRLGGDDSDSGDDSDFVPRAAVAEAFAARASVASSVAGGSSSNNSRASSVFSEAYRLPEILANSGSSSRASSICGKLDSMTVGTSTESMDSEGILYRLPGKTSSLFGGAGGGGGGRMGFFAEPIQDQDHNPFLSMVAPTSSRASIASSTASSSSNNASLSSFYFGALPGIGATPPRPPRLHATQPALLVDPMDEILMGPFAIDAALTGATRIENHRTFPHSFWDVSSSGGGGAGHAKSMGASQTSVASFGQGTPVSYASFPQYQSHQPQSNNSYENQVAVLAGTQARQGHIPLGPPHPFQTPPPPVSVAVNADNSFLGRGKESGIKIEPCTPTKNAVDAAAAGSKAKRVTSLTLNTQRVFGGAGGKKSGLWLTSAKMLSPMGVDLFASSAGTDGAGGGGQQTPLASVMNTASTPRGGFGKSVFDLFGGGW
ncbi:hypothetical protein HDU98_011745, partial [Podochytrium sp. JEL0797]